MELTKRHLFPVKKCFSHQNEPRMAKPNFSVVLRHFFGKCQKNSLLGQKKCYSHHNYAHTVKLSITDVLKHFSEINKKKHIF